MDVTLVSGVDPFAPRASGIRTHVLGLANALAGLGQRVLFIGTGKAKGQGRPWDFIAITPESRVSSLRFLAALQRKSRRLPIGGTVLHAHRPDDLAAFALRRDLRCKVLTVHGAPLPGIRQRHGRIVSTVYMRLESIAMRAANRIIVLDKRTEAYLKSRYPEHADRLVSGSGGVDLQVFHPRPRGEARRELGIDDVPTVGYVGRLAKEKNVELLTKALDLIPATQLIVAGDGPQRLVLERWGRGRDRFHYLGSMPHDRIPSVLNASDTLLLPSLREAMPAVSLEALACGTPVVATRVGALTELIRGGRNGFLAEPDPESVAASLRTALETSDTMRSTCRESVMDFGWDAVARRHMEVYSEASE